MSTSPPLPQPMPHFILQVGQKRIKEEEREPPKKTARRSSKSPSISPRGHSGSSGGGGGGGNTGGPSSTTATGNKLPSSSSTSTSKLGGESSRSATKAQSATIHESGRPKPASSWGKRDSIDKGAPSMGSSSISGGSGGPGPEFVLNAPSSMEPTATQLLMLLVQRDLLKVPFSKQRLDVKQLSVMCPGKEESTLIDIETENSSSSTADSQVKPTANSSSASMSSTQDQKKLTGLLSLLHLEPSSNRPGGINIMPQFSSNDSLSCESSLSESILLNPPPSFTPPVPSNTNNIVDLTGTNGTTSDGASDTATNSITATVTTPVHSRSKLHLRKPHTLARTDLTRARTQHHQPSYLVKSHSASNSPYPRKVILEDHNPASLASSIDKDNLKRSIAAMLRSADVSMDSSSLQFGGSEGRPFSSSCNQLGLLRVGSSSDDSVISLLKQLSDIVCRYYNEQLSKAQQVSSNSNTSGFLTDMGSENLDASSVSSSKSGLGTGSTVSSKTSSDLMCPQEGDQQLASQALDLLETLVTYSKTVREHILMQPPEFNIDSGSRPSSALNVHAEGSSEYLSESSEEKSRRHAVHFSPTTFNLMRVSGRLGALKWEAMAESTPPKEKPAKKVKHNITNLPSVWLNKCTSYM